MGSQRGSITLEMAVLAPALLALLLLVIFAGRVTMVNQSVNSAAVAAARAATLARTPGTAKSKAAQTATATLANQHLNCASVKTATDTSGFAVRVGRAASVTSEVTCTISFADLAAIDVPGSMTLTATATSPLDTYRER